MLIALLEHEEAAPTAEAKPKGKPTRSEAEIAALQMRVAGTQASQEELHNSNWALQARTDEVGDLQRALSDAHVFVWEEKDKCQRLQAENDELKVKADLGVSHLVFHGRKQIVQKLLQNSSYNSPPRCRPLLSCYLFFFRLLLSPFLFSLSPSKVRSSISL